MKAGLAGDRGLLRVNAPHSSSAVIRFKHMIITANMSPEEYFGDKYEESPFLARFQPVRVDSRAHLISMMANFTWTRKNY
jgi:hypothetical protein